jgi:hypothetical protein
MHLNSNVFLYNKNSEDRMVDDWFGLMFGDLLQKILVYVLLWQYVMRNQQKIAISIVSLLEVFKFIAYSLLKIINGTIILNKQRMNA